MQTAQSRNPFSLFMENDELLFHIFCVDINGSFAHPQPPLGVVPRHPVI